MSMRLGPRSSGVAAVSRGALVVLVVLVMTTVVVQAPALAAGPTDAGRPHVRGTETVPAYSYADAIRELIWVDSPHDFDGDGRPDRVTVDLIRPREAAEAGVRVPVIVETSPYYYGLGRGNENETKEFGPDGPARFPLFYDNYFVPRGYAVALVDSAGSGGSRGCWDLSGPSEVGAAVAVVDWLNGRTTAFNPLSGAPAVATAWSSGVVGMIGKSYDGGLAIGAAVSGVEGLATVVPITSPTDYYELWRPGGAQRNDTLGPVFDEACAPYQEEMERRADFVSGNYNEFWAERDYVSQADQVTASVFMVAGRNDANVHGSQFARWWEALGRHRVPRKLWLSSVGHVDPFDFRREEWVDTLHRWFDHWLQGLPNGVMREPRVSVEVASGRWVDDATWPASGSRSLRLSLALGTEVTLVDVPMLGEADAVSAPTNPRAGRLAFLTGPLPDTTRISGVAQISLRLQADMPTSMLTARLVEYGPGSGYGLAHPGEGIITGATESCWGESTDADDACYFDTTRAPLTADLDILARGWIDAAHRDSLTHPRPLRPDRWNTVRLSLDGEDRVVPAGHQLGLVLTLTDPTFVGVDTTGATVTVDLSHSRLSLPIVR
jgi:X-Pro dipeptidyl-peptidase